MDTKRFIRTALYLLLAWITEVGLATADDRQYLYIQTNDIREGQNAILGYTRSSDGSLEPLPGNPYYTAGTGINNDTHAKLGPNDNDTPLVVSQDQKWLFAVNTHSNTIAVFGIAQDGSLQHVPGSPFSSHGIAPNSLSIAGNTLLASNRNEDYHQLDELRGAEKASYVSFRVEDNGGLRFVSKVDVEGSQKPTQVFISTVDPTIAFGNDFQVDADFDGDEKRSFLAGLKPSVQGQLHVFHIGAGSELKEHSRVALPETKSGYKYKGMDGVPSTPLGIWTHPKRRVLYVGFVTRNELGVFRYEDDGELKFLKSVPNSGQDICWVLPNKSGTRLYTINNLPRSDKDDEAATVSTYDIDGEHAEGPEEIARVQLPHPGEWFVNNRNFKQPGSTAFQCALASDEGYLYVVSQRVNQSPENTSKDGNYLHCLRLDDKGIPSVSYSRDLGPDGVYHRARPQGVVTVNR